MALLSLVVAVLLVSVSCSKKEEPEQPKGFSNAQPGPNMQPPGESGTSPAGSVQPPPPGGIPDEQPSNIRGEEQPVYVDPTEGDG
jgi:hypothetical protein